MEYLTTKYIFKNLHRGDVLFIANATINPKTKKPYSYDMVRKVLQGQINNSRIVDFARKYLNMKEKLVQDAAKQSA